MTSSKKQSRVRRVKAWARICTDGCGFIEVVPKKLRDAHGVVYLPCTITYSLPHTKTIKGRKSK